MSLEDIEAIRRLTASYNRAFDESRHEDWANHFTDDGYFERSNAGQSYTGRAAIAELGRSYPVRGWHVTSEHIIDVDGDGDTAHQSCYLMFLDRDQGFAVNLFGVYSDDLVKVNGEWLFKRRLLKVDEG